MKRKLLLTLIALPVFASVITAQITKESLWIGGSLGYNSDKIKSQTSTRKHNEVTINPAFGKAVKENVIIGADLLYSRSNRIEDGYIQSQKSSNYGLGVFSRKYLQVINRFYIFGQARLGVNRTIRKTHYSSNNSNNAIQNNAKGWAFLLSLYPGVSYALNNKCHLEAGFQSLFNMQYAISNEESVYLNSGRTNHKTRNFSANSNLNNLSSFSVGFRLLMAK